MSKSLVDYLKEIPDPRKRKGRHHELWQILLIIIMGIMSGNLGYQGLGRFVERHRRNLIKQLGLKQGTVPSYSTMRRIMMEIDYTKLNAIFNTWASEQVIGSGEGIAGDGKSLRNTVNNWDNSQQNFISMVSLFSQQQGTVVAMAIMENKKESEINVIQELLTQLKLENHLLTLDALHCQKKTVVAIVGSNNDYIIKVKGNQSKLREAIRNHTEEATPVQVKVEDDPSRGRNVQRVVEIFTPPPNIDPSWQKVQSVMRVTRSGERDGKAFTTLSYYISSLLPTATSIGMAIRKHWHIENRLHWVKDVILNEDRSTQKAGKAPINLSILKTWILSIFRVNGFNSIKAAIEQFAHDLPSIFSLLNYSLPISFLK